MSACTRGCFRRRSRSSTRTCAGYCDVRDVGKAAKDWPMLNFIIYHSAYRFPGGGTPEEALAQFEQTGRIDWVTDLAEIPEKYGVNNVYGDLGQVFATTTVAQPRLAAAHHGHARSRDWARTTWCGARMRCGPARRNGRSKGCGDWRSPRTCRRSTVLRRWARPPAGEERHLRRELCSAVRDRADQPCGRRRPAVGDKTGLSADRRNTQQSALRLRSEHLQGLADGVHSADAGTRHGRRVRSPAL